MRTFRMSVVIFCILMILFSAFGLLFLQVNRVLAGGCLLINVFCLGLNLWMEKGNA